MARPVKWRRVCDLPGNDSFGPLRGKAAPGELITMTVDEYETIRLIDLEGLNQEECASRMNVARTTVQGIYIEARRKLADALVNGKALQITGGEYRLCDGDEFVCGKGCRKQGQRMQEEGLGPPMQPGRGRGRNQGQGMGMGKQQGCGRQFKED